jgi:hypothetical protein
MGTNRFLVYVEREEKLRGTRILSGDTHSMIKKLYETAHKYNIVLVKFNGKQPLKEQIQLFGNAAVIFGIHGAGLTVTVEIPLTGNTDKNFQKLSQDIGHRYILCDIQIPYLGRLIVTPTVLNSIICSVSNACSGIVS